MNKMKRISVVIIFLFIPLAVFAGGAQTQSGRDTNADTVEGGQFVNPSMVDAYEYIND